MFRLWGKIMKNNEMTSDHVFELDNPSITLEEQVILGLESLCYHFDLQKPMWLSDNTKDLSMVSKTRFKDHHFVESIDFDYFEIHIIETDD